MRKPLEIPPGLVSDDTSHASAGRWQDGSNIRFRFGKPQVIGGWESLMSDTLSGVCRNVFPWTDNANTLTIAFGTHATLELWQGGALYDITPSGLAAGQIDGTGSTGYGTGAYGVGGWNQPSATDYFPRTWSLAAWGENLAASPRGGTIYLWENDTSTPAAAVSNAPANVKAMLVSPTDQIFALGCNEEGTGTYNPLCIRHSSVRLATEWNTASSTTARQYVLPGGGEIISGRVMGQYLLIWTSNSLFLGTYLGQLNQVWRFDKVGDHCGLIGPNAAVVVGQTAYWISPDRQFWAYGLGGAPQAFPCPIRTEFDENLAASQADKIVASSISAFSEIRFDYPDARDGEGLENSRYLSVPVSGPDQGSWSKGEMARTAFVDAGPSLYPAGVDPDGQAYWHERGGSADGSALSWFVESADQYLSEETGMMVRCVWPDVKDQTGPVTMTITTRERPEGSERSASYVIAPTDDKVDTRISGRLARFRFAGSASPTAWRLGRMILDLVSTGTR